MARSLGSGATSYVEAEQGVPLRGTTRNRVWMSEMVCGRVRWKLDDGVARIWLARPEAGNALDLDMARGIGEVAQRVDKGAANGTIRVVVLGAEGKAFCVGGDLREFARADDRGAQVGAVADEIHRAIVTLRRAPVPVVSAVHGTIAGGGIGVALAADVVLVAEEVKLRLAYTAAGLSPDCGATWMLARTLGRPRAMDLALSNRPLTGSEAAAWGLVSRAVPAKDLDTVVEEVVESLRTGSAAALAATKHLVESADATALADQMDDEARSISTLIVGADGREGVDAFLEKRRPIFT